MAIPTSSVPTSLEMRARRRAERRGWRVYKNRPSAARPLVGFQVQDAKGKVLAGAEFELSIEEVLAFLTPLNQFEPRGELGKILREYCQQENCSMEALTALSNESDPYRFDNESGHRAAQWFKDCVKRLVASGKIHLRGGHYRIVAVGDILRPSYNAARRLQWVPYVNDFPSWQFIDEAASAARWLGYVPFGLFVDERSSAPEIYVAEDIPKDISLTKPWASKEVWVRGVEQEPLISPDIRIWGCIHYTQPYRLVFIGEKSSLRQVLGPIAQATQGELLLPNGELSLTHLYEMCERASLDPRPLVILYFTDFDPSGYHMPTNVSRRIQALIDLHFHDLEAHVVHVALTREQAEENDLPSTPLKETELRAAGWKTRWGREQTEIDALAALRPEVLRQIAWDAVKPYFDLTAEKRAYELRDQWRTQASEILHAHPAYDAGIERLETTKQAIENAVADARQVVEEVKESLAEVRLPRLEPIELELAEPTIEPVYDSTDDWVTATRKLIERKKLAD